MTNRDFMNTLNNKRLADFLKRILCSGECGCCPIAGYNFDNCCVENFLNEETNPDSKIFISKFSSEKFKDLYNV